MTAGRPSVEKALAAVGVARERHANRARTRMFRGMVDGRDVLVTLHDPEGYGEIAFRDDNRWGVPSELFEVE